MKHHNKFKKLQKDEKKQREVRNYEEIKRAEAKEQFKTKLKCI